MLSSPTPKVQSISAASRGETRGFPYFSLSSLVPRPTLQEWRRVWEWGYSLSWAFMDNESLLLILQVAQIIHKTSTWPCITVSGREPGNSLPSPPPLYVWGSSSAQGKVCKQGTFGRSPGDPPLPPSFLCLQVAVQWYVEALNWVQ